MGPCPGSTGVKALGRLPSVIGCHRRSALSRGRWASVDAL